MARIDIDKARERNALDARREPYWGAPVERGLSVGFRRLEMGGNWVARYHTEDKRHVYQALGTVSVENDYESAKREARRWRKSVDAGVQIAGVETVADACADYVTALRREKRTTTADDAERRFTRIINSDPLGSVRLAQLRESHLEAWRDRMEAGKFTPLPAKRGRPPTTAPMTPSAFKRNLSVLKAALNHAVRKRYVSAERAQEWAAIKPDRDADGRRELYLERADRRALLNAAEGEARDLLECVMQTGCRPGDPAAMLRKDYDARTGSVTFRTKTGNRVVPLTPDAKALLDRLAKSKKPNDHMFTRPDGKPWQSSDWSEAVNDAVARAGLPSETVLYTLRHCWITDAITGGLDLLTVARLTGTSLAMIEKHYGHLVHGAARDKLAMLQFV
ncbi:MAG: tyrosine-type recombinase/integrase [Pseudomonas sp.]